MSFYEIVFVLRQDAGSARVGEVTADCTTRITEGGGRVIKTENWGLRTLAYRIRRSRKGYYVLLGVEAPAHVIPGIEERLRHNENVIRFLTVRTDRIDPSPSPPMRQDRDHDDRPRRARNGGGEGRGAPPPGAPPPGGGATDNGKTGDGKAGDAGPAGQATGGVS